MTYSVEITRLRDYLKDSLGISKDPQTSLFNAPASFHMCYSGTENPQWLIHFTSNAAKIASSGFKFGHPNMYRGLGLTAWQKDRKKDPGYNFAFKATGKDARIAAKDKRYGNQAVLFWGEGIKVYHYADEEEQIVFWGPSVDKATIFPIYYVGRGYWDVRLENGKKRVFSGKFNKVVNWIGEQEELVTSLRLGNWEESRDSIA